jgi:acyl-coenzyme A synthetase/AMP-(fatty) acid ligase
MDRAQISIQAAGKLMLLSIAQLLVQGRAAGHPVYHDADGTVCWQAFGDRVARLGNCLASHSAQTWLLAHDDAGEFALWLLALLATGKRVLIPPNFQPGTLMQFGADCDAQADSIDIETLPPTDGIPVGALNDARLALYTSGSSGESKCVVKTLAQLEREVAVLESLWGTALGRASLVATVPHHHIYGLLFRLLWPLMAGRPFDTAQCAHPDTLQQRIHALGDTALIASPAQLTRMPQLIALEKIAPWPRLVFSSGGPLPLETGDLRQYRNRRHGMARPDRRHSLDPTAGHQAQRKHEGGNAEFSFSCRWCNPYA